MLAQNIKQPSPYRYKPLLELPHFVCSRDRSFTQMQKEHRDVMISLSKKLHRFGIRLIRDDRGNKKIGYCVQGCWYPLSSETLYGYCQDRFTLVGDAGSFSNIYNFCLNSPYSKLQFVEPPRQSAIQRLWMALRRALSKIRSYTPGRLPRETLKSNAQDL